MNGAHGLAVQQHVVLAQGQDLGNAALNRKSGNFLLIVDLSMLFVVIFRISLNMSFMST